MKAVADLKVGDTAYDVRHGEVIVQRVKSTGSGFVDYPFLVQLQNGELVSYTVEGKAYISHKYPSLYVSNPFTANQGKWMMVTRDNEYWRKRFVIAEKNGKFIAWCNAETDEEVLKETNVTSWTYAKEIEETVPEYTMEELVSKLGNFKIKK